MSSLLDSLSLRLDDLSDPRIEAFMEEHLRDMRATSPPESVHALDMARMRQPEIRFWTAWLPDDTQPAPVGWWAQAPSNTWMTGTPNSNPCAQQPACVARAWAVPCWNISWARR